MIDRIAAAPISWGICEVPGWGLQMSPSRILGEMAELGITKTELGALGWLPDDLTQLRSLLDKTHMSILGGFVPLVLHHGTSHPGSLEAAHAAAKTLSDAGGQYFVAALISSMESWDRPTLDATEWANLFDGIVETEKVAAEYGLTQVVHPHVNTLIETADEFERFLENSPAPFCLDTGHLFIGGADPGGDRRAARRPCRSRPRQRCRQVDFRSIPCRRVRLDGSDSARFVPVRGFRRCTHRCYGANA